MIETILLALLTAKIRKYKLTPLVKEWTIYPVLIFALIYVYLDYSVFHGDYSHLKYSAIFKILYLCTLSILVFKHRQYNAGFIGASFVAFGGALNGIVLKANGGKMPVFPSLSYTTGYMKPDTFEKITQYDSMHILGSSSSKLTFLADKIDLGYGILSIGDVFIHLMAFVIIYSVIEHLNRDKSMVAHQVT